MKTCTLQEQNVKPDVQVGVAEIYPFTPLARQPNNTNLKSDDSDDENFTAKMCSGSFQT